MRSVQPWELKGQLGGKVIAPSILSADFARLGDEIASVAECGADWIHVDVMDGSFVPNLTIGAPVVRSIRKVTQLPLDCHLMVNHPETMIDDFARAGADGITIHVESTSNVKSCLDQIHAHGLRAGITLRPKTAVEEVLRYLNDVELVLVMTVEPGFGGQKFLTDQVNKIQILRTEIAKQERQIVIQVDGGVNDQTRSQVSECDNIVAGSYIFGASDRSKAIRSLI